MHQRLIGFAICLLLASCLPLVAQPTATGSGQQQVARVITLQHITVASLFDKQQPPQFTDSMLPIPLPAEQVQVVALIGLNAVFVRGEEQAVKEFEQVLRAIDNLPQAPVSITIDFLWMPFDDALQLGCARKDTGEWELPFRQEKMKEKIEQLRAAGKAEYFCSVRSECYVVQQQDIIYPYIPKASVDMVQTHDFRNGRSWTIGAVVTEIALFQNRSISLHVTPKFSVTDYTQQPGSCDQPILLHDGESVVTAVFRNADPVDNIVVFVMLTPTIGNSSHRYQPIRNDAGKDKFFTVTHN